MKKIIYLYLIFFTFPSLPQTQIGSGSYSTNFPVIIKPGLEIKDLYFVDFSGKLLKPKSISRTQNNLDINVSNLNEGMYILEIVSDKEVDKIKILIVR